MNNKGINLTLSYAITVCDEIEEIKHLLSSLIQFKREEDEIVVLMDDKGPDEVWDYLLSVEDKLGVLNKLPFNNNFGEWKNKLNSLCSGYYILNLDADEFIHEQLIYIIPGIIHNLEAQNIDVANLSRINVVKGITDEYIKMWGWRIDDQQRINFPDKQSRLYKNKPGIQWSGKVHERIIGYNTVTDFPDDDMYCIRHFKTIDKQVKQNTTYGQLT